MTLRRLSPGQVRLLRLAVKVDIPQRMGDWLLRLESGEITDEMRDVFEAFGYLDKADKRQRKPSVTVASSSETEEEIQRAIEDASAAPLDLVGLSTEEGADAFLGVVYDSDGKMRG